MVLFLLVVCTTSAAAASASIADNGNRDVAGWVGDGGFCESVGLELLRSEIVWRESF